MRKIVSITYAGQDFEVAPNVDAALERVRYSLSGGVSSREIPFEEEFPKLARSGHSVGSVWRTSALVGQRCQKSIYLQTHDLDAPIGRDTAIGYYELAEPDDINGEVVIRLLEAETSDMDPIEVAESLRTHILRLVERELIISSPESVLAHYSAQAAAYRGTTSENLLIDFAAVEADATTLAQALADAAVEVFDRAANLAFRGRVPTLGA